MPLFILKTIFRFRYITGVCIHSESATMALPLHNQYNQGFVPDAGFELKLWAVSGTISSFIPGFELATIGLWAPLFFGFSLHSEVVHQTSEGGNIGGSICLLSTLVPRHHSLMHAGRFRYLTRDSTPNLMTWCWDCMNSEILRLSWKRCLKNKVWAAGLRLLLGCWAETIWWIMRLQKICLTTEIRSVFSGPLLFFHRDSWIHNKTAGWDPYSGSPSVPYFIKDASTVPGISYAANTWWPCNRPNSHLFLWGLPIFTCLDYLSSIAGIGLTWSQVSALTTLTVENARRRVEDFLKNNSRWDAESYIIRTVNLCQYKFLNLQQNIIFQTKISLGILFWLFCQVWLKCAISKTEIRRLLYAK
jgi:hypothetical protein